MTDMTMNPIEYAALLNASGFTFEDFAEQYPNLAASEYGDIVRAHLTANEEATTEQQLTAIQAKSYKEQTEAFGRTLNRLALEAAADCSEEILAILQEDDREARASYRSEKIVDDNGQSIDVVATALGLQDITNDGSQVIEGTGVSSTQIIISNLALYVGKQAAWKSGFNADSYAKAQSKLKWLGIEEEVFDNYGRLKGLPKANGKPRKQRVARKVKPSAR